MPAGSKGIKKNHNNILEKKTKIISALILLYFGSVSFSLSNENKASINYQGKTFTNIVRLENISFIPDTIVVQKGTQVKWINKDEAAHTVTSGIPGHPTKLFDSGRLRKNQIFSFVFKRKGIYKYFCRIHPTLMRGIVIVR